MKRAAMILAVAAFAAAASTASATAPEFGRCVKVAKGVGSFKNSNCTIAQTGGTYQWLPGPGTSNKFTFSYAGTPTPVWFESTDGDKPACSTGAGTGEYSGTNTVSHVVITLYNCERKVKCTSGRSYGDGVVVTSPLEGILGVVKAGETSKQDKIGLDLFPAGHEGLVTSFECGGLQFQVRGSLIVPVKANKMLTSATLKWTEAKARQKPLQFEGGEVQTLEMSTNKNPFNQAGFALTVLQTDEEPIEINSVV